MAGAHLFVADLDEPAIATADRHHVERVLRLRDGETVSVSDGRGGLRPCVFRAGGALEPAGGVERVAHPQPPIAVGFALVKGERPEWIVQKLTECGVDQILPFVAARSIVRWDPDKARAHADRWRRIAREAAMQSRRVWLPEVAEVTSFDAAVAAAGPAITGAAVALADPRGEAPPPGLATVFVGPEGGWTDDERATVLRKIRLAQNVLRSETAAIAAAVLLGALRSRLVAAAEHEA